MNKKTICITCAFRKYLENNENMMVMSVKSNKLEAACFVCGNKIGHSKELDRLIGIYHRRRHEESYRPRRGCSLLERFNVFRKNKYNGDTLNCFIMAIRGQGYKEDTIRRHFNKLVDEKDMEFYDRKKLISELLDLSRPKTSKSAPNKLDFWPFF